ncbi:hypothetical protein B0H10DRAFT_1974133 [Mycena sp. CBHHK59/15]|nr:hypothetical protein B0H10DRAFT_1974133 [Mycena sp. CBHHK59/15]
MRWALKQPLFSVFLLSVDDADFNSFNVSVRAVRKIKGGTCATFVSSIERICSAETTFSNENMMGDGRNIVTPDMEKPNRYAEDAKMSSETRFFTQVLLWSHQSLAILVWERKFDG